ncbi:hypothetical protein [Nocardia vinacea]|uniref:hypothetical protein n=1 Tax=Nocardia vinacea TaxID=96468 RepID=UPI0005940CC8|nr:hypothetical protein [Nocardia vinacea]
MPGQHRRRPVGRKRTPLAVVVAVCGIAAIAAVVLWVVSPTAQHAAVQAAPAAAPSTAQPAPAAAAEQIRPSADEYIKHLRVPCSTELAGTRPHVAQVGHFLGKMFGITDIGGALGRGNDDHGAGLAVDLMTSDSAQGDAIAEFVLANQQRFGVTYVIWRQRYNDGNGWSYMEDKGSPTANHYDHVHVSFAANAPDVDVQC